MCNCAFRVEIFKMATIAMVTMKGLKIDPIGMKLHYPWDVHISEKCLLNYEYQNIEYQVDNLQYVLTSWVCLGDFVVGIIHEI